MAEPPQFNVLLQRAVELMTAWKDSDSAKPSIELGNHDLGLAVVADRLGEDARELIAGLREYCFRNSNNRRASR